MKYTIVTALFWMLLETRPVCRLWRWRVRAADGEMTDYWTSIPIDYILSPHLLAGSRCQAVSVSVDQCRHCRLLLDGVLSRNLFNICRGVSGPLLPILPPVFCLFFPEHCWSHAHSSHFSQKSKRLWILYPCPPARTNNSDTIFLYTFVTRGEVYSRYQTVWRSLTPICASLHAKCARTRRVLVLVSAMTMVSPCWLPRLHRCLIR